MRNLKQDTNEPMHKKETVTDTENRLMAQGWEGWIGNLAFCSVTQSCLTLCDPMDCITPGFPVHCQLLELAQTHVHQVGDAIWDQQMQVITYRMDKTQGPSYSIAQGTIFNILH